MTVIGPESSVVTCRFSVRGELAASSRGWTRHMLARDLHAGPYLMAASSIPDPTFFSFFLLLHT